MIKNKRWEGRGVGRKSRASISNEAQMVDGDIHIEIVFLFLLRRPVLFLNENLQLKEWKHSFSHLPASPTRLFPIRSCSRAHRAMMKGRAMFPRNVGNNGNIDVSLLWWKTRHAAMFLLHRHVSMDGNDSERNSERSTLVSRWRRQRVFGKEKNRARGRKRLSICLHHHLTIEPDSTYAKHGFFPVIRLSFLFFIAKKEKKRERERKKWRRAHLTSSHRTSI